MSEQATNLIFDGSRVCLWISGISHLPTVANSFRMKRGLSLIRSDVIYNISFPPNMAIKNEFCLICRLTNRERICYNNQYPVGYYNISDARKHFLVAPTTYEMLFCFSIKAIAAPSFPKEILVRVCDNYYSATQRFLLKLDKDVVSA